MDAVFDNEKSEIIVPQVPLADFMQLEAQLLAEQDLRSLVLEAGEIGLWHWNPISKRMEISDSWFEMTGIDAASTRVMLERISLSELSQKSQLKHLIHWWADSVHPDDVEEAQDKAEKYLLLRISDDNDYRNMYRFKTLGRGWITLLSQGRAHWTDGNLDSLFIVQTEVTQLAESERQLRQEVLLLNEKIQKTTKAQQQTAESQRQTTVNVEKLENRLKGLIVVLKYAAPISLGLLALLGQVSPENLLKQQGDESKKAIAPTELRVTESLKNYNNSLE